VTATVLKLLGRRMLAAIPILLVVSALLFCVLRVLPVDPAAMSLPPTATIAEVEAKRHEMGLDQPLHQQYLIWLEGALRGDFGRSIHFHRESGSLVAATLPATIELAVAAMVFVTILGIGGGLVLFHVCVRIADALDLFSVFVRYLDIKLFFKTHHELNEVQRISSQVLDKPRVFRDFSLVNTEFVDDDLFDLILNF